MPLQNKVIYHYLSMWDINGLEYLEELSYAMAEYEQWKKETMWSILKDTTHRLKPSAPNLQAMIIRASLNQQRKYEIYTFNSELSYTDINDIFAASPQIIINMIRNVGDKIYSSHTIENRQVVI